MEPDLEPNLDEFLLARIAEDKRIAADAAAATGNEVWSPGELAPGMPAPVAAAHAARFDPARVLAECAAKRATVLACREAAPDLHFLGTRPRGLPDFPVTPHGQHQLAALTLALLALPYAHHHDYQDDWRP
jgi:Family of unknown function (DUF6221)